MHRDDDQVVVASSAIFRIYDICDNRFQERANLRSSKGQNLNYSCNDVCWNKNDTNVVATGKKSNTYLYIVCIIIIIRIILWSCFVDRGCMSSHLLVVFCISVSVSDMYKKGTY